MSDLYSSIFGWSIGLIILALIINGIFWGAIAYFVGERKGITSGFIWGFFLGPIGLIVVAVMEGEKESNNSTKKANEDKYDQLGKIAELKEKGAISEEEYEKEKLEILGVGVSGNVEENEENLQYIKKKNKKEEESSVCPKCGDEVMEGDKFCGNCGTKL